MSSKRNSEASSPLVKEIKRVAIGIYLLDAILGCVLIRLWTTRDCDREPIPEIASTRVATPSRTAESAPPWESAKSGGERASEGLDAAPEELEEIDASEGESSEFAPIASEDDAGTAKLAESNDLEETPLLEIDDESTDRDFDPNSTSEEFRNLSALLAGASARAKKVLEDATRSAEDATKLAEPTGRTRVGEVEIASGETATKEIAIDASRLKFGSARVGDRAVVRVNGVEFAFIRCPIGSFHMGSPKSEFSHWVETEELHKVKLTQPYWLCETETTLAMWRAVMDDAPAGFEGTDPDLPIEFATFALCQEFISRLNGALKGNEGWVFSLPTEAQWERA